MTTFNYPFAFGTLAIRLHQEYIAPLTNRQLLKEYRMTVERLKEINSCIQDGSDYYLGERITKQLAPTKVELKAYRFEITRRYKLGLISKNK